MHQECAFKDSLLSALQSERCQVQRRKAHVENHFYETLCVLQTFFPLFSSFLLYNFIDHLPIYLLKKNKGKNLFWTQKPKWPKAGKSSRKKTLIMQALAPCSTSDTVAFLQTPLSFRQNYPVNQVYSLCSPLSSPRNRLAVVRCLRFPAFCRMCAVFEDTQMCVWTQSSQ